MKTPWKDANKNPPNTKREVFAAIQSIDIIYDTDIYDDGWVYFCDEILFWMDIPELPKAKD